MPELVWYRSLYWRIALGFVGLLATLLVVQGAVFLWLTGRTAELLPGRSAVEFAQSIASDLSSALSVNKTLDINTYLNSRYTTAFRSFVVVTLDGRTAVSRRIDPPPNLLWAARGHLYGERGGDRGGDRPPTDRSGPDWQGRQRDSGFNRSPDAQGNDAAGRGRGGFGRGGSNFGRNADGQGIEFATVQVAGAPFGVVAVPLGTPPMSVALRHLGPTLAGVALGLLIVGTALAALVVFRPTHRRLRALQHATKALGDGQLDVRATESGGDEVASLAHGFNEMAAALEARNEQLAHEDLTRRQLLADISHEMSTPLAAIRGYVETLGMSGIPLDDATRARYLGIVMEETERLDHIVGDLLDLAKLEGGGGSLRFDTVAVAQLLERVRHRHEPPMRDRQITLETRQSDAGLTLVGDGNRLEQVLQNLVTNAVRHTPDGGRVTVCANDEGENVSFTIDDSGPGIADEHLPHIFDRFYKADVSRTGTEIPSGSGLGLSIVRAIVERHHGTVSASNQPDGGARFIVILPKHQHQQPDDLRLA